MNPFKILVPILVTSIFHFSSGQTTVKPDPGDDGDGRLLKNLWSFAVVGGVVAIFIVLILVSWFIGKYKKSRLQVIYDGCGPSDYKVKYQVRVKTGSSLEMSPANNPKQIGYLTMDLCKPNGSFIARIKVPEETIKKKNKKISKLIPKNNTKVHKFCFASSKNEKDLNIGSIRLDYSKFGERIFVHYIEIKGIEGTSTIYRCFVNSKIGLIKPVREDLIRTTQMFSCNKNEGVTDRSDPLEFDLTPSEYVLFFMIASSVHCICSRYFLYDFSDSGITRSAAAASGAVTGFISFFITFLAIVVYRIGIKKNLGPKIVNGIRITILVLLVILSLAFYISAAILGSDLDGDQLKRWAIAVATGLAVIIITGLPVIIGFQYCCRCVSQEPDMEENETITRTLKSAIGDQEHESKLQPATRSPKLSPIKPKIIKGKSPIKSSTKQTKINIG